MANISKENAEEASNVKAEMASVSAAASTDSQINELKQQTATLMALMVDMKNRQEKDVQFLAALSDVKAATAMIAGGVTPRGTTVPTVNEKDCGCDDDCGCTDPGCCCFEIVLEKVRGIQAQLEPGDIGEVTVPVPTMNAIEVRFFASIDGIGVLVPSLSTTMDVRMPGVLTGGGPGLWQSLGNLVVGRVCLKKGTTKVVTVDFQGQEEDAGIERPIHFKDEYGEASSSITLDCCMSKIYPPMPVDLSFNQGGLGGGLPGAISIAYYARRVCC